MYAWAIGQERSLSVDDQKLFNFSILIYSFTVDCFMSVVVLIAFGPISVWLVSGYSSTSELQDGWGRTWASCKQHCVKMNAGEMCSVKIIERW